MTTDQEFVGLLSDFSQAAFRLNEAWRDEERFTAGYPFKHDFREVVLWIHDWWQVTRDTVEAAKRTTADGVVITIGMQVWTADLMYGRVHQLARNEPNMVDGEPTGGSTDWFEIRFTSGGGRILDGSQLFAARPPQPSSFTVIGLWINDVPVVAGVAEGTNNVVDEEPHGAPYQRWATTVEATNVEQAERVAVAEMKGALVETGLVQPANSGTEPLGFI